MVLLRHARHALSASMTRARCNNISGRPPVNGCIANALFKAHYHSYPDPNERPIVTNAKSDAKRTINKHDDKDVIKRISIDEKFKLDTIFPGVPVSKGLQSKVAPDPISTKLANGITIATQDLPGSMMASFSFMVASGSAFENQTSSHIRYQEKDDEKAKETTASDDEQKKKRVVVYNDDDTTGVTHMLELLAFKSTPCRSHQDVIQELEKLGAMIQCVSSRESVMFCCDVFRENLEKAIVIISDCILNSNYSPEEIDECKNIITIQHNEWPADLLSRDAAQLAAYKGSPLGNFHYCPTDYIDNINRDKIIKFKNEHFYGENIFIGGAGVENDEFVSIVKKYFGSTDKIQSNLKKFQSKQNQIKSLFTGGLYLNQRDLKEQEFTKVSIAYEIGGWHDPLLVPSCVMQQLLGGGSSFSAGGPGKGMYTRLYREALNQHHWIESAESFLSIQEESGLFGIDGACPAEYVQHLMHVIFVQLIRFECEDVGDEEFLRAKNMLKSMMMMQLESRIILCEDIIRQFATFGKRESPASICSKIDNVQKKDLRLVASKMLDGLFSRQVVDASCYGPAVGCVGNNLGSIPPYQQIKDYASQLRKTMGSESRGKQNK